MECVYVCVRPCVEAAKVMDIPEMEISGKVGS